MKFEIESQGDDTAVLLVVGDDEEDGVTLDVGPGPGWTLRVALYHREMLALREEIDKEVEQ